MRTTRVIEPGRALLAIAVAAGSWTGALVPRATGLDISWIAALHMAAGQHLRAGHDWVYTYGPAGFVSYPAWFGPRTGALSVLVNLAARVVLAYVVFGLARARLPAVVAAAFTAVLVAEFPLEAPEMAVVILAAVTVPVVVGGKALPARALFAIGCLVGVLYTVKLNTAIVAAGVGVVCAATARDRWRALGAGIAGTAVGFGSMWTALGQRAGDIPGYARHGAETVLGYAEALAVELPGLGWQYPVAAAVVVAIGIAAWAPGGRAWAVAALLGWLGFAAAKRGFIQHDSHALTFFALASVVGLGLFSVQRARRGVLGAIASLVALAVCAQIVPDGGIRDLPKQFARAAVDAGDALALSRGRAERTRHELAALYDADAARLVGRPAGRGLHVEPTEAALVFALGQRWDPLPSFQSFLTFTPKLDALNVRRIESGRPERVLLDTRPPVLGTRHPEFDAPGTRLALLCRYAPEAEAGRWRLLVPKPARCGRMHALATVRLRAGESVPVPAPSPGRVVVARIRLPGRSARDQLGEALWKPTRHASVIVDGRPFRLVRAIARGPLLMAVPDDAPLGPGSGSTEPFQTIGVSGFGSGDALVEFREIPFR